MPESFQEFSESDHTMSGEEQQQQQLVPGTEPWVYRSEVEMLNGHNGDVPPQPTVLVVEESETEVVQTTAAPRWIRGYHSRRIQNFHPGPTVPLAHCYSSWY